MGFIKHSTRWCLFILVLAGILAPSISVSAQDAWGKTATRILWQGLRNQQDDSQTPHGNAPFQIAERKTKKEAVTKLISTQDNEWIISDGWELGEFSDVIESNVSVFSENFDTKTWYNATVPGTVLTSLVEQGVYPEPSYGLNNMSIPEDLKYKQWWYRTSFDAPQDAKNKRTSLVLNGINYKAQVYLNGKKLGQINGAFIRGEYDITDYIKHDANNVLAILIFPPHNPGIAHEQSMVAGQGLNGGQLSLDGPTFIASMGWDWIPGIRDRNIGIWQDVRLRTTQAIRIGDTHVYSNLALPDTTKADITILLPLKNLTNKAISGKATVSFEGVKIEANYSLMANEEKIIKFSPNTNKALSLKNPKLWWPNGYGLPNLYDIEFQAYVENNSLSDTKKSRFGIRELSYEFMINTPEKGNHRIAYTPVDADNGGKPVFNYEEVVKIDEEKLEETVPTLQKGVDDAKLLEQLDNNDPVGHYFVFRVNGVRIFIKGGTSGMDEMMKRISREKLEPAFKLHQEASFNMIRNWTGENTEPIFYDLADEYGLLVWNDFWITTDDTVDPNDHQLFLKNATDVVKRYRMHPSIAIWCPRNEGYAPLGLEPLLNNMIAELDPSRHYHGNSRHLNSRNSGPYGFVKNSADYYTKYAIGFNTEMGAQAIPTANTIKKFIAPEDQWPINDVWAYHDLHHTTHFFGDFMNAVNSYGEAQSIEEFARKSQIVTYNTWRAMIESWNSRMWNNTTGLILWMSHPAWPSMTWQTYTYDFETPGSYFGVKKAQEAIHIQQNLDDNKVIVINNTRADVKNLTAHITYYHINGKKYLEKSLKIDAPANQKTDCFIPELLTDNIPRFTLARLELKDSKGKIVSRNDYWKNWGNLQANQALNQLDKVNLKITTRSPTPGKYIVELSNPSKSIAAGIKLNAVCNKCGEFVLPAYFSDGYFNLLAGEKRTIELELDPKYMDISIHTDGYNIVEEKH